MRHSKLLRPEQYLIHYLPFAAFGEALGFVTLPFYEFPVFTDQDSIFLMSHFEEKRPNVTTERPDC